MNYEKDVNGNYSLLWPHVQQKKLKTIIDIGAWWGPWTLWWRKRAEKIIAFEPNTAVFLDLKQNTSHLKHITIHNTALGDTTGNVSMQHETLSGTHRIKDYNSSIIASAVPAVSVRTLDSYNFQNVDIIKIDVEGFEIPVLNGAKQTILSQRPWIQIEGKISTGLKYGRSKIQIPHLLVSWGMKRVMKKWPDQLWTF